MMIAAAHATGCGLFDGNLILQGSEEGGDDEKDAVGWTLSIDEDDGRMISSASREKTGFIIFGGCTRP